MGAVRFCLLKFGATFRDDQCVNSKFLCLAVNRQLEAVRQKGLKHLLLRKHAPVWTQLLQCIGCCGVHFCIDVESIGGEPARTS